MRRLYALVFMFIVAGSANVFSMQPMFGYNQGMQSTTFNGASTIQYVDLIYELLLSPDGWDFTDTDVGSTATQVFTLSNAGNYRAEDLAITVTGEGFSESSRTCAANPFVMGSMSSCTVTAQFAPTGAGTFSGFVNYSAPNIAKVSVALSGTGVASGPVTQTLDPIATTGGDNWLLAATLSNITDSSDSTYHYTYTNDMSQRYSFPAPNACSGGISKITLFARSQMIGSAATTSNLRLNSYWSVTNHLTSIINISPTISEISGDFTTGPSGAWTPTDISSNSFGFRAALSGLGNGTNMPAVTKFWMVVTCN